MENLFVIIVGALLVGLCVLFYYYSFKPTKTDNLNHLQFDYPETDETITIEEKYQGLEEEEIYWLIEDKYLNNEPISENEKNWHDEYDSIRDANIIYWDILMFRKIAVASLIENKYIILKDETDNPHKELINFTLQFYKSKVDTVDLRNEITRKFPIMYPFIINYLTGNSNTKFDIEEIDYENGFNEFIIFVIDYIQSLNLGIRERDDLIRRNFKIVQHSVIQALNDRI